MAKVMSEAKLAKIFHVLATILFTILFCTSLFITGVNMEDRAEEFIIIETNSPFRMILITVVFGSAMLLIRLLYEKVLYKLNRNILLWIACTGTFLVSLYWVNASGTAPFADQGLICIYANEFNNGNFTGILKGQYVARYDQLLGIITVLRFFFLVFGEGNYMTFQYFNACMLPVIVFAGCQIVRKISGDNGRAEMYYLVLIATCFPMYAYTAFVYGDLSSTAVALLLVWILLSCMEKFSICKMTALALTAGIAVQLKKNTLIILVAVGIVILVRLLRKWDRGVLLTGCSILAGVLIMQSAVKAVYWKDWDNDATAIPAISYVAMGLHNTDGHPGWHDNYDYDMFIKSGDDVELATRMACDDIKESLEYFKEDPGFMWYFFKTKVNTQWQAPMYQSIVMNNYIVREQSRLVQMVYNEELLGGLIKLYMKAFQLFMYGCILFWLLIHRKDKMSIEKYTLLIAVFGGFLFSILWEAKTRYIMPYLLLMIPYFAMGLQELTKRLSNFIQKKIAVNFAK